MDSFISVILGFFVSFAEKSPFIASVIVVMGTLRMFLKPIVTAVKAIVAATPSKKDDAAVEKVEAAGWYKTVMFIVDYLASVKLPGAK